MLCMAIALDIKLENCSSVVSFIFLFQLAASSLPVASSVPN